MVRVPAESFGWMPDASAAGQRRLDRAQTAAPRMFVKKDVPYETGFQELSLDREAEVRRPHEIAVRVPDPTSQPERIGAAPIGHGRKSQGEVGYDLPAGRTADVSQSHETVVRQMQQREVDGVRRRARSKGCNPRSNG